MHNQHVKSVIPFRIRIGVTGHRSLPDKQILTQFVKGILATRFLESFNAEAYKSIKESQATPVAFTIVSPLAEGADRLVARAVLEYPGARLEVVIPFNRDAYIEHFTTTESKQDFESLLKQAHRCIELENNARSVTTEKVPPQTQQDRYRRVGEYIVEHCDILIALWDGQPSRGEGGTAEIVSLAIDRGKPVFIVSTNPPHEVNLINGGSLHARHLAKLDVFNAWPISDAELETYTENEYRYLFCPSHAEPIPVALKQVVRERLIPFYVRAAIIAKKNQNAYHQAGLSAYILSTIAVFFMGVAVVFHDNRILSLLGYFCELVLLVSLFVIINHADKAHVHKNWLMNRALAEGVRTACYFVACGFIPSYSFAMEGLNADEGEDWVSNALDEILDGLPPVQCPAEPIDAVYGEYIHTCWIQDQLRYHQEKVKSTERKNRLLKQAIMGVFGAAIAVTCVHLTMFFTGMYEQSGRHWLDVIENMLSVVAVTLPATGAAMTGYRSLMEYSRIESRSSIMAEQLSRLNTQYRVVTTREKLETLLLRANELMMMESQDWVKLMSFADIKNVA